jgi:hypothetical protein
MMKGQANFIIQLLSLPLGFCGVVLFLVGLYYGLTGNVLGWGGVLAGIILAFISERMMRGR